MDNYKWPQQFSPNLLVEFLEAYASQFKTRVEELEKLVTAAEQDAYNKVFDVMAAITRAEAAESRLTSLTSQADDMAMAILAHVDKVSEVMHGPRFTFIELINEVAAIIQQRIGGK